jgi:hypothetical protein
MIASFCVPYINRKSVSLNEEFEDDGFAGFDMVHCGRVSLDSGMKQLTIAEWTNPTETLLLINGNEISAPIECRMVRSGNATYRAGRVRLKGVFDLLRGEEEITFILPVDEYHRFVPALRETFHGG